MLDWIKSMLQGKTETPSTVQPAADASTHTVDSVKCAAIKQKYANLVEPPIVPAAEFFDGNNDPGSIGCNLPKHPGVDAFRKVFEALLNRPDVQAVYMQISELDAGRECWPFADTVYVAGTIPLDTLKTLVNELSPDKVSDTADSQPPPLICQQHNTPVLSIWWD